MTHLNNLVQFLDQSLNQVGWDDSSQNGLQVESSRQEVLKVGLAVDSGLSVLEEAVNKGCQLLIVHHGLFWGGPYQISGLMGKKIRTLVEGGCSLYVSHLPLDGHKELGNNAELVRALGATLGKPFHQTGQHTIGWTGEFATPLKRDDFESKLKNITTDKRFLGLKFGSSTIKTFGVITGGGGYVAAEACALGLDAFITGEPKQNLFHEIKEMNFNVFFAGHYATETFGVKALGRLLEKEFGLSTVFLDQPTEI